MVVRVAADGAFPLTAPSMGNVSGADR